MRIQAFHPLVKAVGWLASGVGVAVSVFVALHDPKPDSLLQAGLVKRQPAEGRETALDAPTSPDSDSVSRTVISPLITLPNRPPRPEKHRDDLTRKHLTAPHPVRQSDPPVQPNPAPIQTVSACAQTVQTLAKRTRVYFDQGAAVVSPLARDAIRVLGAAVQICPDVTVTVLGFADPTGAPEANRALSWRRAQAVLAELQIIGLTGARINAQAQTDTGPRFQVVDRRVDFEVLAHPNPAPQDG